MIETKITNLLGIKYPIIQGAMNYVSLPPLAAAVSNAGGLGTLCLMSLSPEDARRSIREVKSLTNKPFAVNIVRISPYYREYLSIILEEKVPVLSHGFGDPFATLGMKKPDKVIFMPTVGSVKQAIAAEKLGADAVIASGVDAGGHVGSIANTVLIPKTVESVNIPVVAAGGFCDGKGLLAALALGAEAISLGTRFAVTVESSLHERAKKAVTDSEEKDAVVTVRHDGFRLRALIGRRIQKYRGWWSRPWEVLPSFLEAKAETQINLTQSLNVLKNMIKDQIPVIQWIVGLRTIVRGCVHGDVEKGLIPAGQVGGRIDKILTSQEIIDGIMNGAEDAMQRVLNKMASSQ